MITTGMTALQCVKCSAFWMVHTLHPNAHNLTHTHCPDCIPAVMPTINLDTRRSA